MAVSTVNFSVVLKVELKAKAKVGTTDAWLVPLLAGMWVYQMVVATVAVLVVLMVGLMVDLKAVSKV